MADPEKERDSGKKHQISSITTTIPNRLLLPSHTENFFGDQISRRDSSIQTERSLA